MPKPENQKSAALKCAGTLYGLDPGPDFPQIVRMIVEIPKNSSNKYEYDPGTGTFRLDRSLYSPMHYPADYGFIPGTVAEDGDPLDALCLIDHPTFTGCLMEVRPIGVLDLVDQTATDRKIIAVPHRDPRFERVVTVEDLAPHVILEFEHFFTIYKELENKAVETRGWLDLNRALDVITTSRNLYVEILKTAET